MNKFFRRLSTKELTWIIIVGLILCFLIYVVAPFVSAVSYNSTQKAQVCSAINLSNADCLTFWDEYSSPSQNYTLFNQTILVINQTIYVNQTIYSNISDGSLSEQARLDHEYRMKALELGVVNTTPATPVKTYTQEELDNKVMDELAKRDSVPLVTPPSAISSVKNNPIWKNPFVWLAIVGVLYLLYLKFGSRLNFGSQPIRNTPMPIQNQKVELEENDKEF